MNADWAYWLLFSAVGLNVYLDWLVVKQLKRKIDWLEKVKLYKLDIHEATMVTIPIPPAVSPEQIKDILLMYESLTGLKAIPDFGGVQFAKKVD